MSSRNSGPATKTPLAGILKHTTMVWVLQTGNVRIIVKWLKGSFTHRVVKISKEELQGESTFGMKENVVEENDLVELQVKNATKVLESVLGDSGSSFVDLFHVNCEVNH